MRLDGIKQPLARSVLTRAVTGGRVAHAYLFAGDPGLGQDDAAGRVIAALLCAEPDAGGACGRCGPCRKVAAGNHPDVVWVEPEGASFKTSQIAQVIRELRYRPVEGRVRCVVLAAADTMTIEAANRLLKTLEDPPSEAVIFLLATDEGRLPETIRSRCQRVNFRPLGIDELEKALVDDGVAGGERARWVARLARGNPARARFLVEHESFATLYDTVHEDLEQVGRGDFLAALAAAERWAALDAADLALALDLAERALIDAWMENQGLGSGRLPGPSAAAAVRLAPAWRGVEPEMVLVAFARARRRLEARVGAQATVDALFLELQEARAGSPARDGKNRS